MLIGLIVEVLKLRIPVRMLRTLGGLGICLQATGPRQVYSWDITKLAGPVKGQYFDYVMIGIYSR